MNPVTLATLESLAAEIERRLARPEAPRPFLLGIGGPGGSGKSTVSKWLMQRFTDSAELPLDDYRLPRAQRAASGRFGSHPEGNDLPRLLADLDRARKGLPIQQPIFDLVAGASLESETLLPAALLVCDGEIAAHDSLNHRFDLLVIVESHWRTQLNTRLTRDVSERGYPLEKAIEVFLQSNLRDYPAHGAQASRRADFLLYRTAKHALVCKRRPARP